MLYNFFVSGTGEAGVAKQIVGAITKKFKVVGEVQRLIDSLIYKLRVIYRSFDGDFSWTDLGGAILDLGQLILTFIPAGRLVDVVSVLWDISTIL
ncbi:hypothetical protein QT711_17985 [Sporosarcina saromensis]|uniref:Uncharacterized protein n=1 Tax=Sporosarcina saromensis TaxID=359365 RepID=A0ABU4GDK3_9BACL|nr:hypothetical protein [Sporosarcina saromensis]MDW0115055.1 hypothetical protein [Sporosarcina saromensis]